MAQIEDQRQKAYAYDPIENPTEAYGELHRLFDLLTALKQDGIWEDHFRLGQAALARRLFPEAIEEYTRAVDIADRDRAMSSPELLVLRTYLAASHIARARSDPAEPIPPESTETTSYASLQAIGIDKDRRYQILFEVLSIAGVRQKWTDWDCWAREHLDGGNLELSDSKYAVALAAFPHDLLAIEAARGYQYADAARLGMPPMDGVPDLHSEGISLLLSAEQQGHRLSARQHLILVLDDIDAARYTAANSRCTQAQCEPCSKMLGAKLWLAKGRAQYGDGQANLAVHSWTKAAEFTAYPEAYEALLELGRCYFESGKYNTATGFLRSAGASRAPYHVRSEAHLLQGLAYVHLDDIGQASECWKEAESSALAEGDPQAFAKAIYYQFRALACKPQEAVNLLKGASDVRDAADAPEILAARGELMYTQGDFDTAEFLFRKVLSGPSDLSPDVLVLLGAVLRKQPDRIEEAALALQSAAEQYAVKGNQELSQAFRELSEVLSGKVAFPSIDSALRVAFRDPIGASK